MRAARVRAYGGPEVIELVEMPDPQPGPGQIAVKVIASTLSAADLRIRAGRFPPGLGLLARLALGWNGPRHAVLGHDLCGRVIACGPGVTRFAPGDEVVAMTGLRAGAHAEICVLQAEGAVIPRPTQLSPAEAAALGFGGTAALHFLRDRAQLQVGERLLVMGAAGAVGSAAVQIGRVLGAEVTGLVRRHQAEIMARLETGMLEAEGFDARAPGRQWDVILDTTGTATLRNMAAALAPDGRLAALAAGLPDMLSGLGNPLRRRKILTGPAPERRSDLAELARLAAEGRFRPVVDTAIPFHRIHEAHAFAEAGRKRGNLVIGFL